MNSLRDKMYNYEVTPPPESWQIIATGLDEGKGVDMSFVKSIKKHNNTFYFSLAAASVAIIFFSVFIWINNSGKKSNDVTAKSNRSVYDAKELNNVADEMITVPKTNGDDDVLAGKTGKTQHDNKVNSGKTELTTKKYITISGPQGQLVKISSKVAALMVSSNHQSPPNPVWNEKVKRWKDIMKANALAPTTANFLDIVDLTHALNLNNP